MAQTAPAKKMLIMNILDILKRYTDEEHKLSQKQIMDILWSDYDMAADRKTVARNLSNLMAAGYPKNAGMMLHTPTSTNRARKKPAIFSLTSIWSGILRMPSYGC